MGGVVACPTEAVWGLSCDPLNEDAVLKLLALKCRPASKGLILVASSMDQFQQLIGELPTTQQKKMALSWPGPTTWLVPHRSLVPSWIHGDHETVALRVTASPVLSALCTAWGGPLVSTSANRTGAQAARERFQVRRYFGFDLDDILPGAVGGLGRPSIIRDLITDRIIRS